MEFSRDYLIHYYEADATQCLSLPALVQYFEDSAILHSASKGLDLEYYHRNNCGWMLLKWDITIERMPLFGQTVTVTTRVHSMKGFLADREFRMTSADGTHLASARSNWLLVDTVRRRPLRVPAEQYEKFGVSPADERSFVSIEETLPPAGDGELDGECKTFPVKTVYSDIDTNGHVNNVRYITWAIDSLPESFSRLHTPVSIRVQYKKELAAGMNADLRTSLSPLGTESRHGVFDGQDLCAAIDIRWIERT